MDEHTYAREKSRGTYCSLVWIRTLHQTQPTSVMTQHHWSISLDNQKSTIHLSLLKCEVHKDTSLCFTHRLSDKRENQMQMPAVDSNYMYVSFLTGSGRPEVQKSTS